jgi:hypothetical protein
LRTTLCIVFFGVSKVGEKLKFQFCKKFFKKNLAEIKLSMKRVESNRKLKMKKGMQMNERSSTRGGTAATKVFIRYLADKHKIIKRKKVPIEIGEAFYSGIFRPITILIEFEGITVFATWPYRYNTLSL